MVVTDLSSSPSADPAAGKRLLNAVLIVGVLDVLLLFVLLYVAFVNRNEDAISVLGPIHGVGFLALIGLTAKGALDKHWGWWFPLIVTITGGPIGSFIGELKLRRHIAAPATAR